MQHRVDYFLVHYLGAALRWLFYSSLSESYIIKNDFERIAFFDFLRFKILIPINIDRKSLIFYSKITDHNYEVFDSNDRPV